MCGGTIAEKEDSLLIVYPVPGYRLSPDSFVKPHDNAIFGIPSYNPETGASSEPVRGVPWGHTIAIKGRLVKSADKKKGIGNREITWTSAYSPTPRPQRIVNGRLKIIARTDKNGEFLTFIRNPTVELRSVDRTHDIYNLYFHIKLWFGGTDRDEIGVDPEYKTSNQPEIYHHSLLHRTSLSVYVDPPDGDITAGQPITFTATLRDKDGDFKRNEIEPDAHFNVEDVDSIDLTKDPLKAVLVHEMEGRKIEFTGTGIVPIKDENGVQNVTTAVTDENGVATFKTTAPNAPVTERLTYQAHYRSADSEHTYITNPNDEPSKYRIEKRRDQGYFFDADSLLKTFDTRPQKWFDQSQGMQPVRSDNRVIGLIDGSEAFSSMVEAIATARNVGHYIYMSNWWMDLNFELLPGKIPPDGTRSSKLFPLLANAVTKGAQVRAMLWNQFASRQNSEEVRLINLLADGAAILDNNTLNFGSHHQKILIVKGEKGLIGFCGGVDFNPDRITVTKDPGTPQHDVHCRIEGPAAWDLLQVFNQRWTDHPASSNLDIKKGILRGLAESIPSSSPPGKMQVQIGRTYGNGSAHAGIRNKSGQRFYSFAPHGERTAERLIFHAIRQARSFIYLEDQYLISMDASNVLRAQLPKIQYLIILIPHSSISDLPRRWELRKKFIDNLRGDPATRSKVVICYRKRAGVAPDPATIDPAAHHTYVHSKMFVFDDRFAIIGSANCNNRGYNHDSEVVAGILDDGQSDKNFTKELRISLWQEHLNLSRSDVIDPLTSARHWFSPSIMSPVAVYDQNASADPGSHGSVPLWVIDPFGG